MNLDKFFFIGIIIVFLFLPFSLHAQNPSEGIKIPWRLFQSREEEKKSCEDSVALIIPEYFLLGTLRFIDKQKENQIDYYYVDEPLLLVDFLKDYIQKQLKISISIEKREDTIGLFSVELARIMNSYFNDNGVLDLSFFDSKEKIYSYLSGYYLRSGSKLGEDFYSFDRYNNIFPYSLLEEVGCQKIVFLRTKYHIPGGSIYYFEPSVLLEKYFDVVEKEMINKIQDKMRTSKSSNSIKKDKRKYEKSQIKEMIEQIFNEFER